MKSASIRCPRAAAYCSILAGNIAAWCGPCCSPARIPKDLGPVQLHMPTRREALPAAETAAAPAAPRLWPEPPAPTPAPKRVASVPAPAAPAPAPRHARLLLRRRRRVVSTCSARPVLIWAARRPQHRGATVQAACQDEPAPARSAPSAADEIGGGNDQAQRDPVRGGRC